MNLKKKAQLEREGPVVEEDNAEFQIPDNLRMKRSDTEKVKLQKRKKVKVLKFGHKQAVESKEMGRIQNNWASF